MPQASISYNLKAHMRPPFGQTVGGPSFIARNHSWSIVSGSCIFNVFVLRNTECFQDDRCRTSKGGYVWNIYFV